MRIQGGVSARIAPGRPRAVWVGEWGYRGVERGWCQDGGDVGAQGGRQDSGDGAMGGKWRYPRAVLCRSQVSAPPSNFIPHPTLQPSPTPASSLMWAGQMPPNFPPTQPPAHPPTRPCPLLPPTSARTYELKQLRRRGVLAPHDGIPNSPRRYRGPLEGDTGGGGKRGGGEGPEGRGAEGGRAERRYREGGRHRDAGGGMAGPAIACGGGAGVSARSVRGRAAGSGGGRRKVGAGVSL